MTTVDLPKIEPKKRSRYSGYITFVREKAKTPSARSFAWLSLTLFTVSFFMIVAIRPTLSIITQLNKQINDQKELNKKMETKIKAIVAAQQNYAKNVDYLYLLDDALPQKTQFPIFANFLSQQASASGIVLKTISFNNFSPDEKNPESADFFSFSVNAEGDYLKLKQFLKDVEESRRSIKINSALFNQTKKENITTLTLTISGIVFYKEKENEKNL